MYTVPKTFTRLSNHPDFVRIIPILLENSNQYAIRIGKILISTRAVIFLKILTEIVVLEH